MERYNPWWINEPDPIYEEWKSYRVKWIPRVINEFTFKPFSLHFLIGPRQVGKTTAIKILIHKLLEKWDSKAIFYYSCDEVSDYIELGEIIDNYISYRNSWNIKSSIIILDEITFVNEWYRALKSRIDMGLFKNDILIIAGSASIELIAGKERFPGRRGYGKDIIMLPISFNEYINYFTKIVLKESNLLDLNELNKCIEANRVYSEVLMEYFKKYLVSGGFPISIRELFEYGRISYLSEKIYLDWIKSDIIKANKNEYYIRELISYILEAGASPLSWYTIAKNTSISSPHTVRNYIEFLEKLFIIKIAYWISPEGRVNYRKNKKIFIIDPFLMRVFSNYTKTEILESMIIESVVASHISRFTEIYYWKNKGEVDIVTKIDSKPIGFEVKWRVKPRIGRRPIKTMLLDKEVIPIFLASLKC